MADGQDNEELELTEEMQVEPQEAPAEPETPENPEDEGEEETLVSFGDPSDLSEEQPTDNTTVRQMRARIRELEREAKSREAPKPPVQAKPEPTLESCEWDEDKFKSEWRAWNEEQESVKAEQAKAQEEQQRVQQEWQQDLQSYAQKKQALGVPDVDECEETVIAALNNVQQAVLVKSANDPALFMVALAKSPDKLAELSKMQDPIKLAAAIARMEGGIKVVKKRKGAALDTPQSGSAQIPAAVTPDAKLAQLEKEAERTGNRSELAKYRRELRRAGR